MNNTYIASQNISNVAAVGKAKQLSKEREQELDFKWFLDEAIKCLEV